MPVCVQRPCRSEKLVILVHGSFNRSGEGSIDRLAPYFEAAGYRVVRDFDYGWTGTLTALLLNSRAAHLLKALVNSHPAQYVVVAAHSNGCAIAHKAAWMGAAVRQLILIHPALDRGAEFPSHVHFVHVWHSAKDWPTRMARYIPFHSWGDMGRVGSRRAGQNGPPWIYNYDDRLGHSDLMRSPYLETLGPLVVDYADRFIPAD
ncbi:MAG TPA: alpha/beta hydrolase [Terriglobia bacterium]|nr:alpha/beta hydrolase [Terriglobia bacterium]